MGLLQVSGVRFVIDVRKPPLLIDNNNVIRSPGARVTKAEVQRTDDSWAPLRPEELYTVATTDWIAGGGDKYPTFKRNAASFTSLEQSYLESVAEYIRMRKEMRSEIDGRITILK